MPSGFADARQGGGLIFLSGQIAPEPDRLSASDVTSQTDSAYQRVEAVLGRSGLDLSDITYVTAYLSKAEDFDDYHSAWRKIFPNEAPARTTVSARILAENALVEISVVASIRASIPTH